MTDQIRRANSALEVLRLDEAEELFRTALEKDPSSYDAQVGLARTYTRMRRQDAAFAAAEAAVALDPGRYEAHATLGALQFLTDENDEATGSLKRATELEPDQPEPHLTLSQVYSDTGQQDEAEDELAVARTLIERLPDESARRFWEAMAWHAEAYIKLDQGQKDEATACAERAVELKDANPHAACLALSNMGVVEAQRRQYDRAIDYFQQAYDLNPYFHRAGAALGRLLLLRGQSPSAVEVLERVLEHLPAPQARINYAYAMALAKTGRREEALSQYREALANGLTGGESILARLRMVWLSTWGRYSVIGVAVVAVLLWILLTDPSPQAMTFIAVVAVILILQSTVGRRR